MQGGAVVLTTGGFDPVHVGHIKLFQEAAQLGKLIVGLNSDAWLTRKRGRPFMNRDERRTILLEMKSVSEVIAFDDGDLRGTAIDAIKKIYDFYSGSGVTIYFAKGGDRSAKNIPELEVCKELGIEVVYGVGGFTKPQSSSRLLQSWGDFIESKGDSKKDSNFSNLNYGV